MNAALPGVIARLARVIRRRLDLWVPCACTECRCGNKVQTNDVCPTCVDGRHSR